MGRWGDERERRCVALTLHLRTDRPRAKPDKPRDGQRETELSLEGFDVAVVGAGPAGSAAALTLAREGVQVLLVERGTFPGSKNVFGGRIYSYALKRLLGERWKDAPVERFVRKEGITFMTADSSFSVEYESKDPTGSFTSIRSKFDKWLAEEAQKAGASPITDSRVDEHTNNLVNGKGRREGPGKF